MLKYNDGRSIRVLAFLDAYERQTCLWDTSLDSYKNKIDRDQAYMAIIKELNVPSLTVHDIKLKVKGIRTTYTKELRNLNAHKKSGKPYKPKLFWFNKANSFLKNVCSCRRKKGHLLAGGGQSGNGVKLENQSDDFSLEYTEESYNDEEMILLTEINEEGHMVQTDDQNDQHDKDDDYTNYIQVDKDTEPDEFQIKQQPQSVNQTYEESSPQCMEISRLTNNKIEPASNTCEPAATASKDDEFDVFCRSVASQLRAIPDSYSRSMAKLKIQQIVFEAETGHYKNSPCVTIPI